MKKEIMEYTGGWNQTPEEKKATNTAFILMFPSLILAGIAVFYAKSIFMSFLAIALAFYEFLMLHKFIIDYYKVK